MTCGSALSKATGCSHPLTGLVAIRGFGEERRGGVSRHFTRINRKLRSALNSCGDFSDFVETLVCNFCFFCGLISKMLV